MAQSQYTFGDKVNVRKAPKAEGGKVCQLPAGHPVEVISSTDELDTLMGMAEPWHEVNFEWKGRDQRGWIWGGLLCWQSEVLADGSRVLMGRRSDEENNTLHRILILKEGKTLLDTLIGSGYDTEELEHFGGTSYECHTNTGLEGIQCMVILGAEVAPCGYSGDFLVFGWTGRELIHAFDYDSWGGMNYDEEGGGYMEQFEGELIFPTDSMGRSGLVGFHSWETYFDEDEEKEVRDNDSTVWYSFNGKDFVPVE